MIIPVVDSFMSHHAGCLFRLQKLISVSKLNSVPNGIILRFVVTIGATTIQLLML